MKQYLYRYVDYWCESEYISYKQIMLEKYRITKHTPCGAWIQVCNYPGKEGRRFVLLTARKQFACLTIKEALISFKKRKEKQVRILTSQLKGAKEALDLAYKRDIEKDKDKNNFE